jgi:hypothetical protein
VNRETYFKNYWGPQEIAFVYKWSLSSEFRYVYMIRNWAKKVMGAEIR